MLISYLKGNHKDASLARGALVIRMFFAETIMENSTADTPPLRFQAMDKALEWEGHMGIRGGITGT